MTTEILKLKDGDILHVTDAGWKRQAIGTAPEGGRHTFGGLIDPVPFAFTYALASVIDNHGGSAAEDARKGFTKVRIGQLIEVEGIEGTWILEAPAKWCGGDSCKLRRVGPKPEGALV